MSEVISVISYQLSVISYQLSVLAKWENLAHIYINIPRKIWEKYRLGSTMKPKQYEFGKVENSAHIYIDMTGKNLGKI
ncbi:MAG: hypothetical protein O4808_02900, partial [Trichodesmium sp. St17_bin3_1_1]|nr:hypothetical protein [Trichodesmium sp. St17_bin3_1_1]